MITPERRADLDQLRHDWGVAQRSHVKRRPVPHNRWADALEYEKTHRRMRHLAEHLELLQRQYHGARELYCDRLLSDLINVLIRKWPDIELGNDLKSVAAAAAEPGTKVIPEHDAPISFFRDMVLGTKMMLTADDWHYLLATCLRVKTILSDENGRLNKKKWKQNRPIDAYRHADVDIPLTEDSQAIEQGFRLFLDRWHGTE
jgi:hypothetical protein